MTATGELIILIGIPASGKSTFYEQRFSATHRRVSKDLLRNVRNRQARQMRDIESALKEGCSVLLDNTSVSRTVRDPLIRLARSLGVRVIGYRFKPDVRKSLEWNRRRTGGGRVRDIAVHVLARDFEEPIYDEGFDELYDVTAIDDGNFRVSPIPRVGRLGA